MAKNKKWFGDKIGVGDLVVIVLLVIVGWFLYFTTTIRAELGWFDNAGIWIVWNNFAYVVFFGLITGYLVARILSWANTH